MEMVVVTGTRIERDDLARMPNVTLRVPADFVQFTLNCQNASRDLNERDRDLLSTINALLQADRARSDVALSGGDPNSGFVMPLETLKPDELIRRYPNTPSYSFAMNVMVDVRAGERFDAVVTRAEAFEEGLAPPGRTECWLDDEQMIGVRGAQRHRETLLAAIAADAKAIQARFAPAEIEIRGLNGRVRSQPTGPLELEMFIGYEILVRGLPPG